MKARESQDDPEILISYWPAVAAIAMVLLVVGVTVSLPLAGLALLLLAVSLGGWAAEYLREHGRLKPGPEELEAQLEGRPAPWWRKRSRPWWGTVGFLVVFTMMFLASLRALSAYNLIGPENWPEAARDVNTLPAILATLVLVGSVLPARRVSRLAAQGDADRVSGPLTWVLGLGGAYLVGRILEYALLLDRGVTPLENSAGSLFYWVTAFHAFAVVVGLALLAALLTRTTRGNPKALRAFAEGATLFWYFLVVAWVVLYVLVYLRLVTFEASLV